MSEDFVPEEEEARALDAADPLGACRERFLFPQRAGEPVVYFAGNSLGLQPAAVRQELDRELEDWACLAVDAHFEGRVPWYTYHEPLREPLARIVGAHPDEVVAMNGLTVNLHLMMVSFFRPTSGRRKILMEDTAFPSDTYAAQSQLSFHGLDPTTDLLVARPRPGRSWIDTEVFEEILERRGEEIALLLLSGVNYYSGQAFELPRIIQLARARGVVVGLDLAHAAGNLPLRLHDWGCDFAVWCSYKYLNAGPGAVAGCFVHRRHATRTDTPRFGGWWGNDPERRFRMHLESSFSPRPTADGWQLSNPPVLALAPLRASLELFDEVGMEALRAKSVRLTAYLDWWVGRHGAGVVERITPGDGRHRGCQLSLRVRERGDSLMAALEAGGVVGDFRPPDVVRVAPVPLYNSFHDVWRFGQILERWSEA